MIAVDFNPSLLHPYYFIRKGLLNKIKQYAHYMRGDVLDFGCGVKPYRTLFTVAKSYTGVDYENPGHSHLNEQIDIYYDGETLPFAANSFDSIFSSEVFEHVFNLEEILPEMNRVLKPGGHLLITCPFVWPEHEKPHDFARYTLFALRSRLEAAGFTIEVLDKSGNFFTAVCQLRIAFFHDVILPKLTFPVLIKATRFFILPFLNTAALLFNKILPGNQDMYLSNIVVAKKKV